jgi:hypothetical protein
VGGQLTIIAHVACNNTADSRELAAHAEAHQPTPSPPSRRSTSICRSRHREILERHLRRRPDTVSSSTTSPSWRARALSMPLLRR